MAKKIAFLMVLITLCVSGCAGWGQHIMWEKETYGDCWVGYDDADLRHEECSYVQKYPDPDWEREKWRLERIIKYDREEQEEMARVRAAHGERIRKEQKRRVAQERAIRACREGRWWDLSRREAFYCRRYRASTR
ncbi:MAG: hypothetical protein HQ530_03845 [Parcubacteria group bacterium]|nr:hypothetical protein [Parcubacteria group bacterium]